MGGHRLPAGSQRIMSFLKEGDVTAEAEPRESERFLKMFVAHLEDGGSGPQAKKCWCPLEAGKAREFSPKASIKDAALMTYLF